MTGAIAHLARQNRECNTKESIMKNAKALFKKAYGAVRNAVKADRMIGFNGYGQAGVCDGGLYEAFSAAHGGNFCDEALLQAAKAAAKAFGDRTLAEFKKPVPAIERIAALREIEVYEYI